jgi:DNA-binding PadR family transcriptional regulator
MRRLTVTDAGLAVTAEALREAMAAELLAPGSRALARELLDRIDAKLPSASDHHPARPAAGRVLAGDEILRLLLRREDRYGRASLSNEAIAGELSWKPAGTSVRSLLEDLRRGGWLLARESGGDRLFELTAKGRGRARALQQAGAAPNDEARVRTPEELLDLIYADSTASAFSFTGGERAERIPGIWHRPTVQAAARVDRRCFCELETALREAGLTGEQIHSYGTLTPTGEHHARERWHATRLPGAFGPPPRLARPHQRAGSVIARMEDRACPNCGAYASWLARRKSKRWDELRGRGEADFSCPRCDVRWTVYLEPTGPGGAFDPLADPALCRPRWRYRGGWLHGDALAPPDHHPTLTTA